MQLTREQRWILSNQYRILALLDPDNADDYEVVQEVLEQGFEDVYDWYSEHINRDTVSAATSHEVIQILDMFSAVERGYELLEDRSAIEQWQTRFSGFDGNSEGKQLALARFLITRQGKWAEFKDRGDGLNSHMPTLDAYRRMLAVWEALPGSRHFNLNADDVAAIATARIHPDNRE